ncbi:MAG: hypothetical protein Q9195_005741 [Heterodermia aff. obscurata]
MADQTLDYLYHGTYEEYIFSYIDSNISTMASNSRHSSDELRRQTSLRISNYWLQFATAQMEMAKWATDLADKAFTEASNSVSMYEADSSSIAETESGHEAKLVATYEGYSEYLGPYEDGGNGPVAKKLVFSAEAVRAINRLTHDPDPVASSSSKGKMRAVQTDTFTEPLATPSVLPGIVNSALPGPGYQTTLPFRPCAQATITTPEPAQARLTQSLEAYRNAASHAQRNIEGLEGRVCDIIEGNGSVVDNVALRNLTSQHPGMFLDRQAESDHESDHENEATEVRLLPGFEGYSSRPAGRGSKDLSEWLGEDERR